MADRRRVTASTPRGPFVVEVSALLPQTDLSVEVAPAADAGAGQPQRQRRPLDYAQLPSDEEEEHGLDHAYPRVATAEADAAAQRLG